MKQISTYFFPAALLLCSLLLVAFSLPRLMAGLKMTYPNTVYQQLSTDKLVANEIIVQARVDAEEALAWNQSGFTWAVIAYYLHELIYSDEYSVEDYLELASIAELANKNSLLLSVVEPYVWYRLGLIHFIYDKQDTANVNFLKLSMYTARVEPDLLILRLTFLAHYLNSLDDELKGLMLDQIRLAWQFKKHDLLNLVITTPDLKPFVYNALNADDLLKFNQDFEKTIQKNNRQKKFSR